MGSQCQDHFRDLERQRDQEGIVCTTHTSRSQACSKSHVSQEENTRNMQREIDHLKRSLHYEQRKWAPSNPEFSFRGEGMIDIGAGRELHLVSPSHMIGIIIISVRIESRLQSAWETMLWVKHSTRFLSRLSRVGSKRGDFLSGFLNPHSPCTTEGWTLWSMLATSIRGWPYTPRMSLWCVRYSCPVWGLRRWGGLIV